MWNKAFFTYSIYGYFLEGTTQPVGPNWKYNSHAELGFEMPPYIMSMPKMEIIL